MTKGVLVVVALLSSVFIAGAVGFAQTLQSDCACQNADSNSVVIGDVKIGFALHLARPGNGFLLVTDTDMASRVVTSNAHQVAAVWKGHPICGADFKVIAEFNRNNEGWRWGFRYDDNSVTNLDVESIDFPIVEAPRSDNSGVVRPKSLGLLEHPDWTSLKPGGRVSSDAPLAFRFIAACDGSSNGLYLDERGARGFTGGFVSENGRSPHTVRLLATHNIEVTAEHNRNFVIPYEGVICRFTGGWYEAARIYGEWVSGETWVRANRDKDRSRLREIALWLWQRGDSEHVIAPAEIFLQETGLKPAVDWYWWHKIPYDTQYPFFWPPREGVEVFRAAVSRMQSKGIFPQVYINGMSWDCDDPSWESGGGLEAVRYPDREGPFWSRMYNVFTQHRLAHLCGEAAKFHEHLTELAKTLSDCGLDGLYLDQIGCSSLGSCWNPSHKHAPGGGRAVTDGYRHLIKKIKLKCPNLLLSTEEPNEEYLAETDAAICLWQNSERFLQRGWQDCEPIPVFQVLHHRDMTLFGSFAIMGGKPAWDPTWPNAKRWRDEGKWESMYPCDQFALEFVRGIVFGNQPCVHNLTLEQIADEKLLDDWRFVKETASFYYANRDVLFDGEMLAPGVLKCESLPFEFVIRGTYTTEASVKRIRSGSPAVLHSVWRSQSGGNALIIVNWTRKAQDYKFTSPDCVLEGTLPARTWRRIDFSRVNKKTERRTT